MVLTGGTDKVTGTPSMAPTTTAAIGSAAAAAISVSPAVAGLNTGAGAAASAATATSSIPASPSAAATTAAASRIAAAGGRLTSPAPHSFRSLYNSLRILVCSPAVAGASCASRSAPIQLESQQGLYQQRSTKTNKAKARSARISKSLNQNSRAGALANKEAGGVAPTPGATHTGEKRKREKFRNTTE